MKYSVTNPNYLATVVRVAPEDLFALPGLDNLRGYAKFGMQALVSRDTPAGLYLLFSTEVQLAPDFVKANNLYRDSLLNADTTRVGYIEQNRRVKAIKLRQHRSESLLIPIESLSYLLTEKQIAQMGEGDVFDSIDGHEVCRKYGHRAPKPGSGQQPKARIRRVEAKAFPEHIDSESYFRNAQKIPADAHVTVTQKLHGTSVRYGNVPALAEQTWWERLLRRPRRTTHRFVVGSRRTIKSVDLEADATVGKNHWYSDGDLWTRYADEHKVGDRIPKDHVIYGELIGFTGTGAAIQKGYTYDLLDGQAELYVYRVSVIGADGHAVDYSHEQMRSFCTERGFKTVPTLWAGPHYDFNAGDWLEARYYDDWARGNPGAFPDAPVQLSHKGADEGVCVRYDGPHGTYILKAKSPSFIRHESALLDAEVPDVEADEAATSQEVLVG